ncbi:hypothetical protein [Streptomyces sp. NPDC015125]|uniref:hypothetical protein n=1 Tax=Streptomyces sp. NPDC015125 TaxID=3364938 RepID=UPI0036F5A3A7
MPLESWIDHTRRLVLALPDWFQRWSDCVHQAVAEWGEEIGGVVVLGWLHLPDRAKRVLLEYLSTSAF